MAAVQHHHVDWRPQAQQPFAQLLHRDRVLQERLPLKRSLRGVGRHQGLAAGAAVGLPVAGEVEDGGGGARGFAREPRQRRVEASGGQVAFDLDVIETQFVPQQLAQQHDIGHTVGVEREGAVQRVAHQQRHAPGLGRLHQAPEEHQTQPDQEPRRCATAAAGSLAGAKSNASRMRGHRRRGGRAGCAHTPPRPVRRSGLASAGVSDLNRGFDARRSSAIAALGAPGQTRVQGGCL